MSSPVRICLLVILIVLLPGCAVVSVGEFQDAETEPAGEHSVGVGITVFGVDPTMLEGATGEEAIFMHLPAYVPNEFRYRYGIDHQHEVHAGVWSVNWPVTLLSLGTLPARDIGVKAGARRMLTARDADFMASTGFEVFGYVADIGTDARFPTEAEGHRSSVAGGSLHLTGTAALRDDAREAIRLLARYIPVFYGRPERVYGGLKINAMSTQVTWREAGEEVTSSGFHIIPMPYVGITSGRRVQSFTEINGLVYFDDQAEDWQAALGFGVGVRIPLGR